MIDQPLYRILNLNPRNDQALSRFGLGVYLDNSFAQKLLNKKESDRIQQGMQTRATEEILRRQFPKDKYFHLPYNFVEDSLLVQSFHVPGDATTISIAWNDVEYLKRDTTKKSLLYDPYNIDSQQQAFGLLCLFTQWVDWAEARMT